jgi:transposase-like protein
MWFIMSQKTGVSAENLKDSMGFGSYQAAWGWLHKFRRVMIRPDRDKLKGTVEVDETFIGSSEKNVKGRETVTKTLVVVAVEGVDKADSGEKLGRVRFRCITDASGENLLPFVSEFVEKESVVVTDGWLGYTGLNKLGYEHSIKVIKGSGAEAHELLPHVHLVISLVKRWLGSTHQGAVRPHHLQSYLDEFAFRFNRRLSTHRGKLFYRLMQQAVSTSLPPVKSFYAKK